MAASISSLSSTQSPPFWLEDKAFLLNEKESFFENNLQETTHSLPWQVVEEYKQPVAEIITPFAPDVFFNDILPIKESTPLSVEDTTPSLSLRDVFVETGLELAPEIRFHEDILPFERVAALELPVVAIDPAPVSQEYIIIKGEFEDFTTFNYAEYASPTALEGAFVADTSFLDMHYSFGLDNGLLQTNDMSYNFESIFEVGANTSSFFDFNAKDAVDFTYLKSDNMPFSEVYFPL